MSSLFLLTRGNATEPPPRPDNLLYTFDVNCLFKSTIERKHLPESYIVFGGERLRFRKRSNNMDILCTRLTGALRRISKLGVSILTFFRYLQKKSEKNDFLFEMEMIVEIVLITT